MRCSAPAQFTPTQCATPACCWCSKACLAKMVNRAPAAGSRGNNPQLQRLANQRKARQAWTSAVQTMVTTLMRRCEIAGQVTQIAAKRATGEQAGQPLESVEDLNRLLDARKQATGTSNPDENGSASPGENGSALAARLPLDLPAAAQVDTQYHLHWPEQLEGHVTRPQVRCRSTTRVLASTIKVSALWPSSARNSRAPRSTSWKTDAGSTSLHGPQPASSAPSM